VPPVLSTLLDDPIALPTVVAGVALALSIIAALGEHRRRHRADLDRPGVMPWRGIAFWSSAVAILAAGAVVRGWAHGG